MLTRSTLVGKCSFFGRPVINNFLTGYKNGVVGDHAVVANFGFSFMLCENHALRKLHKMGPKDSGVLITKLQPLGVAAAAGLKEGDILCGIQSEKVSLV